MEKIVNKCIIASVKCKALKLKFAELQSLLLYLKGLACEKRPAQRRRRWDARA